MTLSSRNALLKAAIVLAVLSPVGVLAFVREVFHLYPQMSALATGRPFPSFALRFLPSPSPYVPLAALIGVCLFALVTLSLIYYSFEKTQSIEALCFCVFVASCSFEALRLVPCLREAFNLRTIFVEYSVRGLLFARYAGMLALFAGSVCASGLKTQKEWGIFALIAIAALLFAARMPVDSGAWDSSLKIVVGSKTMRTLINIFLVGMTTLNFLAAAYLTGSREYVYVGLGAFFALTGKILLTASDCWLLFALSFALLAAGTWVFCTRLRRIYLWL